ncbi:MAG: conserved putative rane protein [Parachlamydiales bacterium]|nr:conserved putative rane protein [Parachlamydiales bacterium]
MTSLTSEVEGAILSAAVSFVILWIAFRKGFFFRWQNSPPPICPPPFLLVLIAFVIYFAVNLFLPAIFTHLIIQWGLQDRIGIGTWVTFLTSTSAITCIWLFSRGIFHPIRQTIWRRNPDNPLKNDAITALAACLIAFPVVIFAGQFLELAVYFIFHTFELPDQLIILFLKMTFGKPLYFFMAIFSIIIFAPVIEEILFRGFLQTYLRRYFNAPAAILIASACFALFHYSNEQGLGNIPIIGSLFIFSIFLGYVYERQGSLLASMILHAAFNALSIANLYFLGT